MASNSTKGARPPGRLSRLLPDRRTGLYLLGCAVLLLGVYFGFTARMQSQHAGVRAQMDQMQSQIDTAQTRLNALVSGKTTPEDEAAAAEKLKELLPAQVDAAGLAADIASSAQSDYQVTVSQMDPGDLAKGRQQGLQYQPFNVQVVGAPGAIDQWLDSLQKRNDLVTVDNVTYAAAPPAAQNGGTGGQVQSGTTAGAAGTGEVKLSFTLKAWFYAPASPSSAAPGGAAASATP